MTPTDGIARHEQVHHPVLCACGRDWPCPRRARLPHDGRVFGIVHHGDAMDARLEPIRPTPVRSRTPLHPGLAEAVFDRCFKLGEPQAEVARDWGVSRERVRQLLWDQTTAGERALLKSRAGARTRLRRVVETEPCDPQPCRLCGVPCPRPRRSYCCGDHDNRYIRLRFALDPDKSRRHRLLSAQHLRRARPDNPYCATLEDRIRDGAGANRRFFVPGSLNAETVLLARDHGWPVWDELPDWVHRWAELGHNRANPGHPCADCGDLTTGRRCRRCHLGRLAEAARTTDKEGTR